MINKFEKQLEKWNNGVLRGAQAKLAKCLHVSTATVALWATGKRHPSKGYLNQLGRFFGMDAYEVSRLFSSIPAPSFQKFSPATTGLRDSSNLSITYSADKCPPDFQDSNSVSLPFFITLPPTLPSYQKMQVAEWWTLPRRVTQGAVFLIRASKTDLSADYENDILFIMPSTQWIEGKTMLVRQNQKYLIRQIIAHKSKLKWKEFNGAESAISPRAKPIGIVVKRLTDKIF